MAGYKGTASGCDLAETATPTLTGDATAYSPLTYTLTVSNHAGYSNPAYVVEVYTGASLVVTDASVTDHGGGSFSFAAPSAGTHEIRVRAQDFGAQQSEIATKALSTTTFGGSYRYWRFTNWQGAASDWFMVGDLRLFDAAGATGTSYPPNMTSAALPSPYAVSALTNYNASYPEWKAFDNTTATFYWAITTTAPEDDWLTIDLGAVQTIRSFQLTAGNSANYSPTQVEILGSATGAFGGEEISLGIFAFAGATAFEVNVIG